MRILDEHITPFMRKWHFPLGFYGEQGGQLKNTPRIRSSFFDSTPCKASDISPEEDVRRAPPCCPPQEQEMIPEKKKRNLKSDQQEQ